MDPELYDELDYTEHFDVTRDWYWWHFKCRSCGTHFSSPRGCPTSILLRALLAHLRTHEPLPGKEVDRG